MRLTVRSDVKKPRSPMSRCCSGERCVCVCVGGVCVGVCMCVYRGEDEQEELGLVTAAGTAAGLRRLCQVHSPVPSAARSGRLRLVLG